jgi:hypothetical protein
VLVRTLRSAISRGTESLVFRGNIAPNEYDTMRAPFQDGALPAPVKYGYLNVGVVAEGPHQLRGRTAFSPTTFPLNAQCSPARRNCPGTANWSAREAVPMADRPRGGSEIFPRINGHACRRFPITRSELL